MVKVCSHLLPGLCGCPPGTPRTTPAPRLTELGARTVVAATQPNQLPAPSVAEPAPPAPNSPKPEPAEKPAKPRKTAASPWSPNYRDPETGEYVNRRRRQTPEEMLADLIARAEKGDAEAIALLAPIFEQIDGQLARTCFAEFFKQAWKVIEPSTELVWNWHLALMCAVLQAVFEDWLRAKKNKKYLNKIRNVIFNVPPGSSKPVRTDGLVMERRRGLVPIWTIVPGDEVLTHRGRYRKVLAYHAQGELPIYRFTTARGRVIEVAGDHGMLTQRGWVRADEVTTRDVFAEVHAAESGGDSTTSHSEARLLGYLIGDGCISHNATASFTNQDPEAVSDFQACARELGFDVSVRERPPSLRKKATWSTHVVALKRDSGRQEFGAVRDWLEKHALVGRNSHTKRVPDAIMRADEDTIAEYLAAYWSCDGGIHDRRDLPRAGRKNQTTQTVRIDATTVSEGLARDHQALLQRLGLSFSLRRKVAKLSSAMTGRSGARVGDTYVSWQLVACDQDTAAKFMQVVGSRMRHEKRRRAGGLERANFDRVLHPDAVVEISTGTRGECCCLTVEEDESFVYQGVAVHNSRIIAVCFQAWCWLHAPGMKFICLSVNDDATMRDARAARELIRSPWYVGTFKIDWSIKTDQDAISNYGNTKGGERISMASKSEIVGLRGDCILVDDPNNPKKAENKNERDEVNNLWSTNQANRVNDGMRSLRIGVQQRTHAADWTGNVLELQGRWTPDCGDPSCKNKRAGGGKCCNRDGWLHVVLPAEFEPERKFTMPEALVQVLRELGLPEEYLVVEDPRATPGESIDPLRMPLEYLAGERKRWSGTTNFANQMQQSPVAAEGNKVQRSWLNFCRLAGGVREDLDDLGLSGAASHTEDGRRPRPAGCHSGEAKVIHAKHYAPGQWDFDWITISLDCASKKTDKGSQYGILVIAGKGGRYFVLEDATQRGSLHEIIEVLVGSDDNPERPRESGLVQKWRVDSILIEPKAAGPSVMDTLVEQMARGDIPMVTIWECDPGNSDKEMRLEAAVPYIKNGQLYLLDGAPWLEEFVKELTVFPNGLNDDRVDALSQCLNFKRAVDEEYPDL